MKLRIKYKSTRNQVEIQDTETFAHLVEKCQVFATDGNWYLSLNGLDEIEASSGSSISSIGLVSGDMVHVVEREVSVGNDLITQLLQMGFDKNPVEKVVQTFGASSLNDAIELLSMLGSTSNNEPVSHPSPTAISNTTMSDVETDCKNDNIMDLDSKQENSGASASNQVVTAITKENHLRMPPLFLQDGITESFHDLLKQVKCDKGADYLCLFIHGLVTEAGFTVQSSNSDNMIQSDDQATSNRHSVAQLPDNWKNSAMGLYRLNYKHRSTDNMCCCITATVTGSSMLVSGTLDEEDSDAYQIKFKISDYVNISELSSGSAHLIYRNHSKLSHKIKDTITTKIINEIRSKLGLNGGTLGLNGGILGLITLPLEIQLRILCYLDVVSISRLSRVARDIATVCNDESVWRRVLSREFKTSDSAGRSYKQVVKDMYIQRREERLQLQREQERLRHPRPPLRPDFGFGPDLIYPGAPAGLMPGIIGGYSDLHPSGGFQPGGPRHPLRIDQTSASHPDLLRGRRPPGARFDPYGSLPDDDDFNAGGRPHPDMLQRPDFDNPFPGGPRRPTFGRGSRSGGGFGFF